MLQHFREFKWSKALYGENWDIYLPPNKTEVWLEREKIRGWILNRQLQVIAVFPQLRAIHPCMKIFRARGQPVPFLAALESSFYFEPESAFLLLVPIASGSTIGTV